MLVTWVLDRVSCPIVSITGAAPHITIVHAKSSWNYKLQDREETQCAFWISWGPLAEFLGLWQSFAGLVASLEEVSWAVAPGNSEV